ncbi:hypothetical protein FD30_GL000625 [Levilactobacillus namurensis DSM 19117]|uniref:WxL domain-containing protein n=1 Tax=Levilactobacillus namurensis DSM 19117 TaxID=1423773 RepID=A0A0R1JQS1_9LACO|nr:WxL domain-containing protein [Levilactobacillus namurensis]KRK73496.1 hypothetical protein FD30_GL000625 [Levilactobacillus namurensis DSM 19117]GEO75301.1 hypothetical protein LNA02_19990 [Levilactobacillus namurensis]
MKRRLRTILLTGAAALVLGLSGLAVPALADTTTTTSSSSTPTTSQSTTASETFTNPTDASISLDSAPSIGFAGAITPNTKSNESYTATSADNPVEVSNQGLGSGYNVQVANSAFTNAAGNTLGGAVLSLGAPEVAAANTGNPSAAPVASAVTLKGDGTNSLLLDAPVNGGLGVFDADLDLADVTLAVPAGQLPGTYTSNLTFTLGDTAQ